MTEFESLQTMSLKEAVEYLEGYNDHGDEYLPPILHRALTTVLAALKGAEDLSAPSPEPDMFDGYTVSFRLGVVQGSWDARQQQNHHDDRMPDGAGITSPEAWRAGYGAGYAARLVLELDKEA